MSQHYEGTGFQRVDPSSRRGLLSLEAHVVSSPFLLIEFKHIGTQAELAQQAIAQLFQFAQHLVLFLLLLLTQAVWQSDKGFPRSQGLWRTRRSEL